MPRLRHSPGAPAPAPTLLSNTRPQTHISITALPWNLSSLLSLHLPQNSPISSLSSAPSISIPPSSEHSYICIPALLPSQQTLLLLPHSPFPPPPLPLLRTGLKVLFITRAGNMALKNHPIIIFHPANSTHSHRDIITTPCHTGEMEAADFQPGRVCVTLYVCARVCVCVCETAVCPPAFLLLLLILKALHKRVFKMAVREGDGERRSTPITNCSTHHWISFPAWHMVMVWNNRIQLDESHSHSWSGAGPGEEVAGNRRR